MIGAYLNFKDKILKIGLCYILLKLKSIRWYASEESEVYLRENYKYMRKSEKSVEMKTQIDLNVYIYRRCYTNYFIL